MRFGNVQLDKPQIFGVEGGVDGVGRKFAEG